VADYYPVQSTQELDDGRLEVRLRVHDPLWLVQLALRLTPLAEVVEPVTVREAVERSVAATLRLYTGTSGGVRDDGVAWPT
jgi:proteasome accessory factor C